MIGQVAPILFAVGFPRLAVNGPYSFLGGPHYLASIVWLPAHSIPAVPLLPLWNEQESILPVLGKSAAIPEITQSQSPILLALGYTIDLEPLQDGFDNFAAISAQL